MEHAYKWILKYGGGLAFILIIAWPCLALPAGVFSKGYFTFWFIISIIWGLVSRSVSWSLHAQPSCLPAVMYGVAKGCRQLWLLPFRAVASEWPGGVLCPQILCALPAAD